MYKFWKWQKNKAEVVQNNKAVLGTRQYKMRVDKAEHLLLRTQSYILRIVVNSNFILSSIENIRVFIEIRVLCNY